MDSFKTYKIKVITNSKKNEIEEKEKYILVKIKAKPENNQANEELLNILKNHFHNNNIYIVSGHKSPNKIIKIIY